MPSDRSKPGQGVYVYRRVRGAKVTWVVEHDPGGKRAKQYRIRASQREAEAEAERWRAELATAPSAAHTPGTMTVADACEHFLLRAKHRLASGGYDTYNASLTKHVLPKLGHIPVTELQPAHVRKLIDEMLHFGSQPSTARNAVAALRAVLNLLVEEEILTSNPASMRRGWLPKITRKLPTLTMEQIQDFMAEAVKEPIGVCIEFLATTGARLGEVLALRWADIDLEKQTAHISKTVRMRNERERDRRFARRSLDLPTTLVKELGKLPHASDSDLVFPGSIAGPDGKNYLSPRVVQWALRRCARRAGLPPVNPHMLRHTWARLMLERGASMNYVSVALGHHSATFTAQVYESFLPKPRSEDVDELGGSRSVVDAGVRGCIGDSGTDAGDAERAARAEVQDD